MPLAIQASLTYHAAICFRMGLSTNEIILLCGGRLKKTFSPSLKKRHHINDHF
jgi:hypothetical protein